MSLTIADAIIASAFSASYLRERGSVILLVPSAEVGAALLFVNFTSTVCSIYLFAIGFK